MSGRHDIVGAVTDEPDRSEASEKVVKVPIAFPESLYEWLREAAFVRRVSMAHVVREAVTEYRARED